MKYILEAIEMIVLINQFSCSVVSDSLRPRGLQHTRLPWSSPTPRAYSNWSPSSRWLHPTISSSVIFSSHLQSFPASGSFPRNKFFVSGGQSIGVSASASVLPMNIQDWFPLGLNDWISLQSKGLSRVFSNTTVQKDQFSRQGYESWTIKKPEHQWIDVFELWYWRKLLIVPWTARKSSPF